MFIRNRELKFPALRPLSEASRTCVHKPGSELTLCQLAGVQQLRARGEAVPMAGAWATRTLPGDRPRLVQRASTACHLDKSRSCVC